MSDKSYVGMTRCFFCGEHSEILLNTRLHNTLPHDCGVVNMRPCTKCEILMKQGVILIAIKGDSMKRVEEERQQWRREKQEFERFNAYQLGRRQFHEFIPNPERTGGFFVVRDEAIRRLFNPQAMADWAIQHRWIFIDQEAVDKLGLAEAKPVYASQEELEKACTADQTSPTSP